MRIKTFFLLIIISLSLKSISNTNQLRNSSKKEVMYNLSQQNPEITIIKFLRWYRDNRKGLVSLPLIKGGLSDSTFYSVNFQATEQYLNELEESGFLSKKYINNLKAYFKKCDDNLKKHPQNDGPVYGFEADLILQTQEYQSIIENIDKAKVRVKKINNNTSIVYINIESTTEMVYSLTKHNGSWLIDTFKWNIN